MGQVSKSSFNYYCTSPIPVVSVSATSGQKIQFRIRLHRNSTDREKFSTRHSQIKNNIIHFMYAFYSYPYWLSHLEIAPNIHLGTLYYHVIRSAAHMTSTLPFQLDNSVSYLGDLGSLPYHLVPDTILVARSRGTNKPVCNWRGICPTVNCNRLKMTLKALFKKNGYQLSLDSRLSFYFG